MADFEEGMLPWSPPFTLGHENAGWVEASAPASGGSRSASRATWTDDQLTRIGAADELELSSHRPDGGLRPFVTMWVVRLDDEL
jgi:hypothetical protein